MCFSAQAGDFFYDLDKANKERIENLNLPSLCTCDRRKIDTRWIAWVKEKKDDVEEWIDTSYQNDAIAYMVKSYAHTGGNIWERSASVAGGKKFGFAVGKTNTYNRAIEREFTFYAFYTYQGWGLVFSPNTLMIGYHYRFSQPRQLEFLEKEVDTRL